MKHLYLKVTRDEYSLPLAVADTVRELAKLCGVTPGAISHGMSEAKRYGYNCEYIRIEVEDDHD